MSPNPWDAEWEITPDLVRHLLAMQFPHLAAEPIEPLGNGWDNTVYRIGADYVFRFPRRQFAIPLLRTEGRLLPKLADVITLPFPKPVFYGEESLEYPVPFLGYTHVPGATPYGLSDQQRTQSAERLGRFLKSLHSFPAETAKDDGAPLDHRNLTDVAARRERMLGFLSRMKPSLAKGTANALEAYLQTIPLDSITPKQVLIHGDLHFKNLLVDESGLVSGIIDWGDLNVGHPACDLSIAYSFLPPAARAGLFEAYGEVDEETHMLARLIAVFIAMLIFMQSLDNGDDRSTQEAASAIIRALA